MLPGILSHKPQVVNPYFEIPGVAFVHCFNVSQMLSSLSCNQTLA